MNTHLARLDAAAVRAAATRQARVTLLQLSKGGWIVDTTMKKWFTPARWAKLQVQNQRIKAVRAAARTGSPDMKRLVAEMDEAIRSSCSDNQVDRFLARADMLELRWQLDGI
jgi:hypothetical protein